MPHPLLLELMVQERQCDLERERKELQLLALIPKVRQRTRFVAFVGAYLVQFGTWMQSIEPRNA